MKSDSDLDRVTAEWLQEGSRPLPTRVRDETTSAVLRTRQLAPARPRWTVRLGRAAGLAAAAAAVVMAMVYGPLVADRIRGVAPPVASTQVGADPSSNASASPDASLPAASLPPVNPFLGAWHTTDFDGSSMLVAISETAAGTISVLFTDAYASWCYKNWPRDSGTPVSSPLTFFTAHGVATLGDLTLQPSFSDGGCGDLQWPGDPSTGDNPNDSLMRYDPVSDTVTWPQRGPYALIWNRVSAP